MKISVSSKGPKVVNRPAVTANVVGFGIPVSGTPDSRLDEAEISRRKYILQDYKRNPNGLKDNLSTFVKVSSILNRDVLGRMQQAIPAFFAAAQSAAEATKGKMTEDQIVCLNDCVEMANRLYYSLSEMEALCEVLCKAVINTAPVEQGIGVDHVPAPAPGTFANPIVCTAANIVQARAKKTCALRTTEAYMKEIAKACRARNFSSAETAHTLRWCGNIKEAYDNANWASDADWPFFCSQVLDSINKDGPDNTIQFVKNHMRAEMSKSRNVE